MLRKIITVTIAVVMLFTMVGCGNTQATTSTPITSSTSEVTKIANKPTEQAKQTQPVTKERVTKEAETKKVEPTTVAPTSAPAKTPEVTTEAAKENVPLNAKISNKATVLAFSKDTDYKDFERASTIGFKDDVKMVMDFVNGNPAITVMSGEKVEFENLSGFASLSEELKKTIMYSVGMLCGDTEYFVNNNENFTYAFILCEMNGGKYCLYLYKK